MKKSKPLRRIQHWIASSLLIAGLAGCMSIRTEYPDITYYHLVQQPLQSSLQHYRFPASLWIRLLTVDAEFATDRFVILYPEGTVKRLFYHRWAAEPSSLITDAVARRLIRYGSFTSGIFRERVLMSPRYLLEGRVLEFAARWDEENDRYVVHLSIYYTFSRRTQKTALSYHPLFQELFSITLPCPDDELEQIAPTMSRAVAHLTDQLLQKIADFVQQQ